MNIQMGEIIRSLRKQKNISQDVLAQYLGVSFQAVSKWENGAALPDVAMIPAIASFFQISTDELFDFNLMEQANKVEALCDEAYAFRFSDPARSEAILREGLKQFPGNEIILNNLLYTMRTPERSTEVISICKSLLEVTKLDEVKYDVLRILAETYHETGQQALVKPTLDQIPEIYFSKLELCAKLLDAEDAMDAACRHACIARDDLLIMIARISQLYKGKDEEKAREYTDLAETVYRIFQDRTDFLSFPQNAWQKNEIFSIPE